MRKCLSMGIVTGISSFASRQSERSFLSHFNLQLFSLFPRLAQVLFFQSCLCLRPGRQERRSGERYLTSRRIEITAFPNSAEIALIYVGLGKNDQAMTWLERAYEERFNPSILARPSFDPLRSDKRFQGLVHRIGLSREPSRGEAL